MAHSKARAARIAERLAHDAHPDLLVVGPLDLFERGLAADQRHPAAPDRERTRSARFPVRILERWMGPASFYVDGIWTFDEGVFGEPGDLTLLGGRTWRG